MLPTAYSLRDLVTRFGGEAVGDAETMVACVGTLEGAGPRAVTLLTQDRYVDALRDTRAAAVIVGAAHRDVTSLPRIVCKNPQAYFARVCALLVPPLRAPAGIHPTATVDASAVLGPGVSIGPYAVVGADTSLAEGVEIGAQAYVGAGVAIGAASRLFPQVVVYDGCVIGDRVLLHPGAVIGADGFGNAFEDGRWLKIPQVGRVRIGNDVEIGANTTVDRGAIDDTVIEEGVRLDNLIMVAHNVHIGAHTAIAACTGIAGSTRIGRYCLIGGAVGIAGHITIVDKVQIAGKAMVTKSILQAGSYGGGYPAEEASKWRRNAVRLRQIENLVQQVKTLEQRLAELEGKSS